VANTHLEAFDATTRARSAELILRRMATDFEPGVPVLVTGDFNEPAGPGGAVHDALVADGPLVDTWESADRRGAAYATFHDYGPLRPDGDRIDWILSTPDVRTVHASVSTTTLDGRYPSDHLPVQAVVRLT
jgi:endonuclease/exonuclease/phosphatase family metal-dependent hydrolase